MSPDFLAQFAETLRRELALITADLDAAEEAIALSLAYDSLPVALDDVEAGG